MQNNPDLPTSNIFDNLNGFILNKKHYYGLRVFYEDTDAGNIVYHANYLKFFERARSSLLKLLNINQFDLKKNKDVVLVARKAQIDWYKAAQLNDTLLIESRLKYAKNSSITIEQKVYRYLDCKKSYDFLVLGVIQIVAIDSDFKVRRIKLILNNSFFKE
ncbi:MAG: YbgC/FadM family acyl-CoA thioesterase [Proteobacteria bacterium]|jgi:acyl-CoA thioester hydrolase|nr:YbgC/FadM family acyl-CoA thioesterase [Pseudomonadota bacterium]MDA1136097.1 YbgC/FadM family acyl-CoA thioesterase [Pseudomonadota bacterium]|tara:strand:+ start:1177 stop:1656 length:480 start_codon:yes stop_codon:yes gene_type:complete